MLAGAHAQQTAESGSVERFIVDPWPAAALKATPVRRGVRSALMSVYAPFVRRVIVIGAAVRFRQNQPCEPSKAATSSPSFACSLPFR